LVDYGDSSRNESVAHPVYRLQIKLIVGLDRHKAHVLPLNGLCNGLGVNKVVLVRLHERLHELCRDQPDVMALMA
jgi:hypothetical protein